MSQGFKLGGILARAVPFHGRLEGIIVGIGINVPVAKNGRRIPGSKPTITKHWSGT